MKNNLSAPVGIGIDIERIERFTGLTRTKDSIFLRKVFTPKELAYCFSKKNPAQHLAVRFAGKESVVKALGGLGILNVVYADIEIVRQTSGAPYVMLKKPILQRKFEVSISLSHANGTAVAAALALPLT